MEWTEARKQKFWERCGFEQSTDSKAYHWVRGKKEQHWIMPNGEVSFYYRRGILPDIHDLNALIEYGMPVVAKDASDVMVSFTKVTIGWNCEIEITRFRGENRGIAKDAEAETWALALAEALWKVLEVKDR